VPTTWTSLILDWRFDPAAIVVAAVLTFTYVRAVRRSAHSGTRIGAARRAGFLLLGVGTFVVATCSTVGVLADELFWARCLQVVLLLMVVPFGLAMGRPLTALREGSGTGGRNRIDRLLTHGFVRISVHPATTSVLMIGTPWLFFLTPWLHVVLIDAAADFGTALVFVTVGFLYFYARLQADPVPRRYSQLISLLITIAEMLGDGVLGIVLWLGPLLPAVDYLGSLRTWGPAPVTDQIIGAGVFWILGDILGMPFLLALLRAFRLDEKAASDLIDAELDEAEKHPTRPGEAESTVVAGEDPPPSAGALWWAADPQLHDRFRREPPRQ